MEDLWDQGQDLCWEWPSSHRWPGAVSVTNTITAERARTPLNQPSWLENILYLAVQEAGACVAHPEGSRPGLGQSLWPGRCCRSRSPFLMCESPTMAVQTRGSTPPTPAAPPGYSRAVGGDGGRRRRGTEGVVDGASSAP